MKKQNILLEEEKKKASNELDIVRKTLTREQEKLNEVKDALKTCTETLIELDKRESEVLSLIEKQLKEKEELNKLEVWVRDQRKKIDEQITNIENVFGLTKKIL